jgi:hypothetical protein
MTRRISNHSVVLLLFVACLLCSLIPGCWVRRSSYWTFEHITAPPKDSCNILGTHIEIWERLPEPEDICLLLRGIEIPKLWRIKVSSGLVASNPVPIHEDSVVTAALNDLYPPRPDYKWVGFATDSALNSALYPDTVQTEFVVQIDRGLPGGPESAWLYWRSGESCQHGWTEEDSAWASVQPGDVSDPRGVPLVTLLEQNVPNPFNPLTRITFSVNCPGEVRLRIYDIAGCVVRTLVHAWQEPGVYSEIWDGRRDDGAPLPSGVYFYRLEAGDFVATRKVVLLR